MADKYFAKYTGVVADNRDAERLGRIEVRVPAIFAAAVVTARAALPFGYYFVPEVGAKVWIEFEGGDPGLPLWTGLQYVAGEWPTEGRTAPPHQRVIKSARSHFIIFSDDSGTERLEIRSNARIVISSLGSIEIRATSLTLNGRPVAPSPSAI
jgi:uncharacterized protein involved in type VI secretion and phage assembly